MYFQRRALRHVTPVVKNATYFRYKNQYNSVKGDWHLKINNSPF